MRIRVLRTPSDEIIANLGITAVEGDEITVPDHIGEELISLRLAEQSPEPVDDVADEADAELVE